MTSDVQRITSVIIKIGHVIGGGTMHGSLGFIREIRQWITEEMQEGN